MSSEKLKVITKEGQDFRTEMLVGLQLLEVGSNTEYCNGVHDNFRYFQRNIGTTNKPIWETFDDIDCITLTSQFRLHPVSNFVFSEGIIDFTKMTIETKTTKTEIRMLKEGCRAQRRGTRFVGDVVKVVQSQTLRSGYGGSFNDLYRKSLKKQFGNTETITIQAHVEHELINGLEIESRKILGYEKCKRTNAVFRQMLKTCTHEK